MENTFKQQNQQLKDRIQQLSFSNKYQKKALISCQEELIQKKQQNRRLHEKLKISEQKFRKCLKERKLYYSKFSKKKKQVEKLHKYIL